MFKTRVVVVELWLLKGIALCLGVIASINAVKFLEQTFFPVLNEWHIEHWQYEGANDVVVRGTMYKNRQCDYIPPIRAVDQNGVHYRVESRSPTSGQNWSSANESRTFGPWVVIGGAGMKLQFYAEHQCWAPWSVFSILGTLDTSTPTGGKRGN